MSYTVSEYRAKILHRISKNTKQNIDSDKCTDYRVNRYE